MQQCQFLLSPVAFGQVLRLVPASLDPGVHSASNRNEYQKHKNNNVSGK
jgi:hypothetical protein